MSNILIIDFTIRLPDISKKQNIPYEYDNYGRFAVLNNGALWFDYAVSSHPQGTKDGYYWAVKKNILYLSPRGANYHWLDLLTDEVLKWLINKLGLDKEYKYFKKKLPEVF